MNALKSPCFCWSTELFILTLTTQPSIWWIIVMNWTDSWGIACRWSTRRRVRLAFAKKYRYSMIVLQIRDWVALVRVPNIQSRSNIFSQALLNWALTITEQFVQVITDTKQISSSSSARKSASIYNFLYNCAIWELVKSLKLPGYIDKSSVIILSWVPRFRYRLVVASQAHRFSGNSFPLGCAWRTLLIEVCRLGWAAAKPNHLTDCVG